MQKVIYIANCTVYDKDDKGIIGLGRPCTKAFYCIDDALTFVKNKTECRPKNMEWLRGGDYSNRYLVDLYGSNEQLAVDITVEKAIIDDKES